MDEVAIGIDLGTSNSCVAVYQDGEVEVLPNAYGEPITASVVAFRDDGSIVVGNAAKAGIIHAPKHTVSSAKRLIGRYFFSEEVKKARAVCSYSIVEGANHSVRIQVRDDAYAVPEVSAMVLREMKRIAEAKLAHPVSKAVVTVPAYFNDNQRQATRDAGRIAGLEVLRLLNEPTAAALAYGFGKGLTQRVAVYDLGGGTFDISVLEIGRDVFEVLSTCGDTFLGGDDFDDRLIDLLADEFVAREGINLRNDSYALEKLKMAAEAAKKGLSVDDEVEIRIPDIANQPDGSGLAILRRLGRAEYDSLVTDLIQRTFKVCDEALQQASLTARDLDGVILVGGPTRLPTIREAVKEYFQKEPKTDVDPDQVVAMGAAIHAASLLSPEQESYLLDVTPLSLRIGVAGGLAETVIENNTPVPIEQTRTFTTFRDHQESVKIRIYQGESRRAEENEMLGEFEFSGFRKAKRGEVRIDVTFEINGDGIVNVTAADPETGQQASTRITLSSGLSEDEIQRILAKGGPDLAAAEPEPPASGARSEAKPSGGPLSGGARSEQAREAGAQRGVAERSAGPREGLKPSGGPRPAARPAPPPPRAAPKPVAKAAPRPAPPVAPPAPAQASAPAPASAEEELDILPEEDLEPMEITTGYDVHDAPAPTSTAADALEIDTLDEGDDEPVPVTRGESENLFGEPGTDLSGYDGSDDSDPTDER